MVQDKILSILPEWADNYLRIDELPEPYQVSHSLNAIHNGGIFGQGISLGNIKLGFLSEVHTDFVLAGITEEIGLVGLSFITFIMFLIVLRIFKISGRVENKIYHLFTIGIALMIIIAFLINSYGISGMIPIKGIAVPFLSYGGSSMLATSLAVGLVLSISKSVDLRKRLNNMLRGSIVITGGGTGGHLKVADALIDELNKKGIKPIFIGSINGQDKEWFEKDKRLRKLTF